jgi:hypothetical protein
MKELKRFQESNIYEMEPIRCSLKIPVKRIEESASTGSALGNEDEYQPVVDDENYSKYTNSTQQSYTTNQKYKMRKKSSKRDSHSLNRESGYSQSSSDMFHSNSKTRADQFHDLIRAGSEKVSEQRDNSSIITCSIDLYRTPKKMADDDLDVDETDE